VEANNPEGGLQASSATVVTKKNTPPDALCVDIILYLLMAMDFQPQTRIRPASVLEPLCPAKSLPAPS